MNPFAIFMWIFTKTYAQPVDKTEDNSIFCAEHKF